MDCLRVWLLCSLLLCCGNTYAQDLSGAPLPIPYITQEDHDRVLSKDVLDPDGLYPHWLASGWTLVVCGARYIKAESGLAQCERELARFRCSDFQDGAGSGLLWKPVSESTGNPALLFPGDWWEEIVEIQIQNSEGVVVTRAKPRTCCPNGGRAHYDLTVGASDLPKNLVVVVVFADGERCFNVADPEKRYD